MTDSFSQRKPVCLGSELIHVAVAQVRTLKYLGESAQSDVLNSLNKANTLGPSCQYPNLHMCVQILNVKKAALPTKINL